MATSIDFVSAPTWTPVKTGVINLLNKKEDPEVSITIINEDKNEKINGDMNTKIWLYIEIQKIELELIEAMINLENSNVKIRNTFGR